MLGSCHSSTCNCKQLVKTPETRLRKFGYLIIMLGGVMVSSLPHKEEEKVQVQPGPGCVEFACSPRVCVGRYSGFLGLG